MPIVPIDPDARDQRQALDQEEPWDVRREREKAAALGQALQLSARMAPERAARVLDFSARKKMDPRFVAPILDELEREFAAKDFDYPRFLRTNPHVARWVSGSEYEAALAKPDLDSLDRLIKAVSRPRWLLPMSQARMEEEARKDAKRMAEEPVRALGHAWTPKAGSEEAFYAQALERIRKREAFIANDEPVDVWDRIAGKFQENPLFLAPFLSAIPGLERAERIYDAVRASREGRASEEQATFLFQTARVEEAARRRGTTFAADVANILADFPAFGGEFLMTGGIYSGVKQAVMRGGREIAEEVLERELKASVGRHLAGWALGSAAQTGVAMPLRAAGTVIERMTPERQLAEGKEDVQIRIVPGTGEAFGIALPKAVVVAYSEIASEHFGAIFKWAKETALGKQTLRAWTASKIGRTAEGFARTMERAGYHGVIAEMAEEEVGKLMQAVGGVEPYRLPTGGELAREAVAFGIPGVGLALANRIGRERRRANDALDHAEEVGKLSALVQSMGMTKLAPAKLAEVIKEAAKESEGPNKYIPAEKWLTFWLTQKDARGNAIDPYRKAAEVTGQAGALERALELKGDLEIPTEKYYAEVASQPGSGTFFQGEVRSAPDEMNAREAKEYLKTAETEAKIEKEAGEKALKAITLRQEDIKRAALERERAEAKEELAESERGDIIARVEQSSPSGRIWWADPNNPAENIEELRKSNVPRRLMALPGTEGARAIDDVAAEFEMGTGELVEAIEKAAAARESRKAKMEAIEPTEVGLAEEMEIAFMKALEGERRAARGLPAEGPTPEEEVVAIRKTIARRMKAVGIEGREAEANAAIFAAFFGVMGPRAGLRPQELFARRRIRFAREGKRKGGEVEQPGELPEAPRGFTRFEPGEALIAFLKTADKSTAIHEAGHLFLELYGELVANEAAAEDLKRDFQTVLDFIGIKDQPTWAGMALEKRRDAHEKFAEAFEKYVYEGKAPSVGLRRVFAKLSAWLRAVYRKLRGLNVELTPELRAVFDRMLATEEEIKAAEEEVQSKPLAIDLPPAEAEAYREAQEAASASARERLQTRLMEELSRAEKSDYKEAREKARAGIERQINAQPDYIAQAAIMRGVMPDGSELPENLAGFKETKLSAALIVEEFGSKRLAKLPEVYAVEGGIAPADAAQLLGFSSADALLSSLERLEPREQAIERLTDEAMRVDFPDLFGSPEIAEEAMSALHSKTRGDLLALEARLLAAKAKEKATPLDVIRQYAERTILEKTSRTMQPGAYKRAERAAGKRAFEAAAKGEYAEALEAKQEEMLNHELYRAADEARDRIERIGERIGNYQKKSVRARIGMAGGDFLAVIDGMLERFEAAPISGRRAERRASIREWYEAQKALADKGEAVMPEIDAHILDEAYRANYLDMAYSELIELDRAVTNVAHLADLKRSLIVEGKKRALDDAALAAAASINALAKPRKAPDIETERPEEVYKRRLAGFFASHRKLANFIAEFDGWKDGGVMWDHLIRPMNEAADRQATLNREQTLAIDALFKKFYTDSERRGLSRKEEILPGFSLSREAQITVFLNWGNLDSRAKLMDGRGWSENLVRAIIDHLDKRDLDFGQAVFDYLETFRPEVGALHKRVTGLEPQWVEAEPIVTRHGVYPGGYYPLKYDPRASVRQAVQEEEPEPELRALRRGGYRASTKHGHRMERVAGVKKPVRLSFNGLFEHVAEVIHDLTHYEFVVNSMKLLGHEEMQAAIQKNYGTVVYKQLLDGLRDIAVGDIKSVTEFEKVLNHLRIGTSIAKLGWNVVTAGKQIIGITQSVERIGARWVARGVSRWLANPTEAVRFVQANSQMMVNRSHTMMREINDLRNSVRDRAGIWTDVEDSFFYLISRMQMVVDYPTYLGAYEKAMEEAPRPTNPEEAVAVETKAHRLADQTVLDAQGGGQIKDLAEIQRGSALKKIFGTFYNFFNTTYNETVRAWGRTDFGSPLSIGRLAVDLLMLYTVPAALGVLATAAIGGGDPKKSLGEKLLREQFAYAMNSIFLLREFAGTVAGYGSWRGPAGLDSLLQFSQFVVSATKDPLSAESLRGLIEAGGPILHYPERAVINFAEGMWSLLEAESGNPFAPIVGAPRK